MTNRFVWVLIAGLLPGISMLVSCRGTQPAPAQEKPAPVRKLTALTSAQRHRLDTLYHHTVYGRATQPVELKAKGVMKYKDVTLPLTLYVRRGSDLRITTGLGTRKDMLRIAGGKVEVPAKLTGDQKIYLRLFTYAVLFPAWEYTLAHAKTIYDAGTERVNGVPSHCYESRTGTRRFRFCIGKTHHYLLRVEMRDRDNPGFRIDFMDFRPSGAHGIMVPRQYVITNRSTRETYRVFWHDIRIR